MSTLDQFKQHWEPSNQAPTHGHAMLDEASLRKVVTASVRTHTKASFSYFWASFAEQLLVYALLSHLLVRHWSEVQVLLLSLLGILLHLPFTVALMIKFRRLAVSKLRGHESSSIRAYLTEQYELLNSFFSFKKRYEWLLIPVISAIGVILVFTLYVPGGVQAFPQGALITYALTLLCCYGAIRAENKKNFRQPLGQLQTLLKEYEE